MHNVTVPTLHFRPMEVGTSKEASKVNFKVLLIKKEDKYLFWLPLRLFWSINNTGNQCYHHHISGFMKFSSRSSVQHLWTTRIPGLRLLTAVRPRWTFHFRFCLHHLHSQNKTERAQSPRLCCIHRHPMLFHLIFKLDSHQFNKPVSCLTRDFLA